MRLAVTGKTGQVVTALLERGAATGIDVIALGRPELDLSHDHSVLDALTAASADVIVSAAAYTAVDKAETEADLAQAVNARGPALVAVAAAKLNVPVIHLSTDYVFDGSKSAPYVENDATGPLGVYGASKLAGEAAIAAATSNHVILRTAWVYSPFGQNFLKTMLRLAGDRPQLRVVDDQRGNPTSALDIADAVLAVARNLVDRPDEAGLRGVFHLAGTGEASWADFAIEIFAASAAMGGSSAEVTRITTADYPTPARRPANSRLSSARLQQIHGVIMPHWTISTRAVVERLVAVSA
nr:dTDP-4-dehydrorhamnose reductase [uncultured Devosia sp.]